MSEMIVPGRRGRGTPSAHASRATLWAVGPVLLLVGCVEHLPPPETPSRELPPAVVAEAQSPARAGRGRLAIDVVDGSARVEDLGDAADGAGGQEICAETPCVAELAVGRHTLFVHHAGRDDRVEVNVSETPRGYRRQMSYDTGEHGEYLSLIVGGFIAAVAFSPAIDPLVQRHGNLHGSDAALVAAAAVAGAGLVTAVIGIVLAIVEPQRVREGASIEWDLAP